MAISKYLDPKNDFAFKKIFGSEKHKDILIHFINDILNFNNHPIKEVTFLKTSQDPEVAAKKQSIVDVLCTDELGKKYVIEMQVAQSEHFVKRAQYYAAKAYSSQLNVGEEYENLKEIIFLAITDFTMFPDKDKKDYKSDHVILDKESHEHDLKDFSFTFIELPKFNKKIDELSNMVDKGAFFFKHAAHTSESDVKKLVGSDTVIEQAYEALNQFNWTEIERNTYEQQEKRDRDARSILKSAENRGIKQGIEQGIEKSRLEIAKKMFSKQFSIEEISELSGLSIDEINAQNWNK